MAAPKHFVIGDLQGCFTSLQHLLNKIAFRPGIDHIYLLGDIVNRGPESLDCLRWAATTPNVVSVLGNHDFHLLAVATGNERYHKPSDTLTDILTAPDKDTLLTWLRHCPLIIHLPSFKTTLVHAGIPPQWTLAQAQKMANKISKQLTSANWNDFIHNELYGNKPTQFSTQLTKTEQLRYAINSFARMRFCTQDGELEFKHKLDPSSAPTGFAPWFSYARIDDSCGRILFGHWSTLTNHQAIDPQATAVCLDSGCLWGRALSALCLEDNQLTCISCPQYAQPGNE
ncbi:MAG: symmetrical bis(5'-nucleosyl)-tetraphosphatase [Thiotrichales bacterium]|jgi:bis(5'-nucleosyl)-tetraphosphatase (symmetrical)|nr:symmetrical bis(5'-nucleosyl)-tetraphosphatase [Thiotrichales bacterium]